MTLSDGWAPFYEERNSSAVVDINQLYLAFVATALFFVIILILPGVKGLERFFFILRWTTSLVIGSAIIACGQGISWQTAAVDAHFRHTVGSNNLTNLNVGLLVGLTQFNVTLSGEAELGAEPLTMNEKFFFTATDGMIEDSLVRGIPFPILTIAEHFSSRRFHSLWPWGMKYWQAGHYASYLLWTSFVCWVLSNVLFNMVLQYGAFFLIFTGILLLLADLSFATVSFGGRLNIHVGYFEPAKVLAIRFGWCFWASLIVGVTCVILGTVAAIFWRRKETYLKKFFMFRDENIGQVASGENRGMSPYGSEKSLEKDFANTEQLASDENRGMSSYDSENSLEEVVANTEWVVNPCYLVSIDEENEIESNKDKNSNILPPASRRGTSEIHTTKTNHHKNTRRFTQMRVIEERSSVKHIDEIQSNTTVG